MNGRGAPAAATISWVVAATAIDGDGRVSGGGVPGVAMSTFSSGPAPLSSFAAATLGSTPIANARSRAARQVRRAGILPDGSAGATLLAHPRSPNRPVGTPLRIRQTDRGGVDVAGTLDAHGQCGLPRNPRCGAPGSRRSSHHQTQAPVKRRAEHRSLAVRHVSSRAMARSVLDVGTQTCCEPMTTDHPSLPAGEEVAGVTPSPSPDTAPGPSPPKRTWTPRVGPSITADLRLGGVWRSRSPCSPCSERTSTYSVATVHARWTSSSSPSPSFWCRRWPSSSQCCS